MPLEAKIDLEKLAKAVVMKDEVSAAAAIGNAVIRASETACQMFRNSLELDMTEFVLDRVKYVKDAVKRPWTNDSSTAKKRRGRKPNAAKEGQNV